MQDSLYLWMCANGSGKTIGPCIVLLGWASAGERSDALKKLRDLADFESARDKWTADQHRVPTGPFNRYPAEPIAIYQHSHEKSIAYSSNSTL
jgi:hypothetical protein